MTTAALATALLRGQNPDGGWAYYPEKSSRLEPTAWATLALRGVEDSTRASAALRQWPSKDGLLLERAGGEPNYAFHGLALLVLRACRLEHSAGNAALLRGLERVKGTAFAPSQNSRQDNSLQGWSWIADTFSWVEPTAWCLLSLKKWAQEPQHRVDGSRLDEAERLLIDRSCAGGGWNYGNSNVLGQKLQPYVPTTAVGLLAMQDRRDHAVVEGSLNYLENNATSERTGSALALALFALRACGRGHRAVETALSEQLSITLELANQVPIAMSLCALNSDQTYAAFTL